MRATLLVATVGGMTLALFGAAGAQESRAFTFTKDVVPIFQRRCQNCHGVGDRGGLKLDTLDNVLQGGAKGEIVIRGNPDQSRLVQFIEGRLMPRMPVGGAPLTRPEIALIRAWIQQGARGDDDKAAAAEKPLEIAEPKDGSTVKEIVRVLVPRAGVPTNGFVSIYIDDKFIVALALPSTEELEEKGLPVDSPLVYSWDTKAPVSDDSSLLAQDRSIADGPHVIEIRSYDADGQERERVRTQVILKNKLDVSLTKPVRLAYGGDGSQLGQQWFMKHIVDFQANAAATGFGRAARSQQGAQPQGGPDAIKHNETSKYLVSQEDLVTATGEGFYRERRESPIIVRLDDLKHVVRLDSSSRYYTMRRTGEVLRSRLMERENREPILNPLDLPGRPQRLNEPFTTVLRLHLGAYITGRMELERLQATLEGLEWQHGEQCAKIRLSYIAGNTKLDINSVGIRQADFQIVQGNSTIWFSEATGRVVRARHDVTGNLMVDTSQFGTAGGGLGGAMGGYGGEGAMGDGSDMADSGSGAYGASGGFGGAYRPGGTGTPAGGGAYGASGGFGGSAGFGAPSGFGGSAGFGAPSGFGGAGGLGAPSGFGGAGGFGAPSGFGGAGGAYGAPSGFGGSSAGDVTGGYGGAGAFGGGSGLPGPKLKRYSVTLKIQTDLDTSTPAPKPGTTASR